MFTYSLLFNLQGRAFLRWSRYETAYVVWQEITARRRPGTVYAAFCLFYITLLNQPITIDESAEAVLVAADR